MIDAVLILIIIVSLISTFFSVRIWKKKNYVKAVYIKNSVSIIFYTISATFTILLLTLYLIKMRNTPYSWLYLLIILFFDITMLLIFCFDSTYCIYLEKNVLYQKNIFLTKHILITNKIRIIRKFDRVIVKSDISTIVFHFRYLSGDINALICGIKAILDQEIIL